MAGERFYKVTSCAMCPHSHRMNSRWFRCENIAEHTSALEADNARLLAGLEQWETRITDLLFSYGCAGQSLETALSMIPVLRKNVKVLESDLAAAEAKLARVVEDMRWFADPENYRHPRPESTSPGPNVLVDGLQIASAALAEIGGGEGRG